MRVLFVTFPVASHYFPMVPLGWALAAAGHDVRVASHPSFRATVEAAGLTGVGVGQEPDLHWVFAPGGVAPLPDPDADEQEALRAARGLTMFAEVSADMATELLPWAHRWRPDVVVFEPRAFAGVIVAHALGVPAVRHLWGVDHTYGRWSFEQTLVGPLLDRFGAGGADPHGALTLDPCPPGLQVPDGVDRLGIRFVPYNGGGAVPEWLDEQPTRPRVCVTWGTTLARQSGAIAPAVAAVHASVAAGAEVVVATTPSQRPMLGELPDGVRVLDSRPPLHLLLASCAAVVHPGGSGTLLTSIRAGRPQVVVPAVADQFQNARRFATTGAGHAVVEPHDEAHDEAHHERHDEARHEAETKAIEAAVIAVLDEPSIVCAATDLALAAASVPPPAAVVDRLTAL